jgi:hypothetical protein
VKYFSDFTSVSGRTFGRKEICGMELLIQWLLFVSSPENDNDLIVRKLSATAHDFLEQSCAVAESLRLLSNRTKNNANATIP